MATRWPTCWKHTNSCQLVSCLLRPRQSGTADLRTVNFPRALSLNRLRFGRWTLSRISMPCLPFGRPTAGSVLVLVTCQPLGRSITPPRPLLLTLGPQGRGRSASRSDAIVERVRCYRGLLVTFQSSQTDLCRRVRTHLACRRSTGDSVPNQSGIFPLPVPPPIPHFVGSKHFVRHCPECRMFVC